jgi:hypothetical protein
MAKSILRCHIAGSSVYFSILWRNNSVQLWRNLLCAIIIATNLEFPDNVIQLRMSGDVVDPLVLFIARRGLS